MSFHSYLASIITVSDELQEAFYKLTHTKEVKKGQLLVRSGERCNDIYFVESGLLRGYYYQEEKEITHWFAREDEFATCFYSFITHVPSAEFIEAIEPCQLVQLPHANLQKLYASFPETERIGRLLTEAYYVRLEGRFLGLQFTTAKERYDNLMKDHPQLLQRASLGHIASYLGITQETLSRIRAKQ